MKINDQVRSQLLSSYKRENRAEEVVFVSAGISCFCLTAYLLSLLPAGDQRSSQYQEFRAEADSLLDMGFE